MVMDRPRVTDTGRYMLVTLLFEAVASQQDSHCVSHASWGQTGSRSSGAEESESTERGCQKFSPCWESSEQPHVGVDLCQKLSHHHSCWISEVNLVAAPTMMKWIIELFLGGTEWNQWFGESLWLDHDDLSDNFYYFLWKNPWPGRNLGSPGARHLRGWSALPWLLAHSAELEECLCGFHSRWISGR